MSEMIERVAKAIAISGNGGTWDDWYNQDQKEFHRKRARAAIEAMREPTKDMVEQFEGHKAQEAADWYWGWMIGVALGKVDA